MTTLSVSAQHLEEATEDPESILRICSFMGYNVMGVVRISIILVREGLTDEICIRKFQETRRHEAEDAGNDTLELFPT